MRRSSLDVGIDRRGSGNAFSECNEAHEKKKKKINVIECNIVACSDEFIIFFFYMSSVTECYVILSV